MWLNAYRSRELPGGARGTSYGLKGNDSAARHVHDILLHSNVDTAAGMSPAQIGASIVTGREKITLWASFDGGQSWPRMRLVYDGPSAYSTLGAGRSATACQGLIYSLFEGGPKDAHDAVQVVSFSLSWLLNGRNVSEFLTQPRSGD